jgi:hypothetical protein
MAQIRSVRESLLAKTVILFMKYWPSPVGDVLVGQLPTHKDAGASASGVTRRRFASFVVEQVTALYLK